ncbi:MAG: hypothetical protein RSD95_07830 [Clostridia bacterium]
MESILTSIKKLLMLDENDISFDADIIMHINTVLSILNQLGVGPDKGLSITDKSTTWGQFLDTSPNLDSVRSYVYLKVKLLFDPPSSSAVIESINRVVGELEWRINATAEALRRAGQVPL